MVHGVFANAHSAEKQNILSHLTNKGVDANVAPREKNPLKPIKGHEFGRKWGDDMQDTKTGTEIDPNFFVHQ